MTVKIDSEKQSGDKLFENLDKSWADVMWQLDENPRGVVIECVVCSDGGHVS